MEDEVIKDEELEGDDAIESDGLIDDAHPKKKKGLLDDDNVESADDLAEDELGDEEESYDDVDEM